jgi:hypothetical protein
MLHSQLDFIHLAGGTQLAGNSLFSDVRIARTKHWGLAMQQMTLFEDIFSDAILVDIDFSAWDKRIALYVLADHAGRTADNRRPMFVVEFIGVQRWEFMFSHLDADPPIDYGPKQHITWRIDEYQVELVPEGMHIVLSMSAPFPRITIICESVQIREFPLNVPDRLFPGWSKPYKGLIRPGLADWPLQQLDNHTPK